MVDSIGTMMVKAEEIAKKKASKEHTVVASCGCQVRVHWFSANSRSYGIDRCSEHPVR